MNFKRLKRWVCVSSALLVLGLGQLHSAEPYRFQVPLGLDEFIPIPEINPRTADKIELGRQLFFDKRLSRDGTVACATCHVPERAFTDGKVVAIGVKGGQGKRNVPTILNRAYGQSFFWDGRVKALEDQPLVAITNPKEMDLPLPELEKRLSKLRELQGLHGLQRLVRSHEVKGAERLHQFQKLDGLHEGESYRKRFEGAFGEKPTAHNAAKALATFVRTLLSGNSAFDRFEHGNQAALSDAAKRGLQIFRGKGNCIACHSGPLLSDEDFHNTGVSWGKEPLDLGRYEVTKRDADRGRFKTPSLRNVALTAPYMHDGSLATLEEVVEFYTKGANPNANLDREIRPLSLPTEEKADLVSFLMSLTGAAQTSRPSSEPSAVRAR